jgi:hypothetical protein
MKKRFTMIAFIFSLITITNAQIPNPGFENWQTTSNGLEPVGWITTNVDSNLVSVLQATPSYQGNYAVKVKVWMISVVSVSGVCQSNAFHYSSHPVALNGYVKCNIMPGDSASIVITVMSALNDTVVVGAARQLYTSSITSYMPFTLPVYYGLADPSDTIYININAGRMGTPQYGTEIIVDDLSLTPALGTNDMNELPSVVIGQNFPNPAGELTIIPLKLHSPGNINVKIFDLLGREIRTIFNETINAGEHQIEFSVADLPHGIYYYTIQGDDFTGTRKFVVSR